jgi:L,D-transpeptidase YnhG
MKQYLLPLVICLSLVLSGVAHASPRGKSRSETPTTPLKPVVEAGLAESRLIEVYKLIAASQSREALKKADVLVRDYPTFQLAQLVYGDLLAARAYTIKTLGDVPEDILKVGAPALHDFRRNSFRFHLETSTPSPWTRRARGSIYSATAPMDWSWKRTTTSR